MREMVLNHASLLAPNQHIAIEWLKDAASGMAELRRNGIVEASLRMSQPMEQTLCAPNWSLADARLALRGNPNVREEFMLLMTLAARVPLIDNADPEVAGRFEDCESATMTKEDGAPLVLCAIADHIAISFPSDPVWDRNSLTVNFIELLPDGELEDTQETIDNLSRASHAQAISDRHREILLRFQDADTMWNTRQAAFANLEFHPDVKGSVDSLAPVPFGKVADGFRQMEAGNMSNAKRLAGGISEFKIRSGPGYRIYFAEGQDKQVVLLCGTKQRQSEDIRVARDLWQNYK